MSTKTIHSKKSFSARTKPYVSTSAIRSQKSSPHSHPSKKSTADISYSFKILEPHPKTIHYLIIRPPATVAEHVTRWLSNIKIK
jgi:hypothetical protein